MKEQSLQHDIITRFRELGHQCTKLPSGLVKTADGRMIAMGSAGTPDLVLGLHEDDDWIYAVCEVKRPDGRLSWLQILNLRAHEAAKRRWLVATSTDDVDRFLEEPSYHGPYEIIKNVFNIEYTPNLPTHAPRSKPSIYDPLIEAGRARILAVREAESEPPF